MAVVTKNVDVAGRRISIETGRVAEQSNGAVILRQGDSVVLSTAVMSKEPREGIDWFPLTCDYEEKLYAAGKIPGAFMRREGRPSETAILASRLTDRPLRPLFPEGFRLDVQVVSTVLSVDQENDPTILSINGASTALVISDIPFQGPVGAVRMGYLDGEVVVNPSMSKMADSQLDLVVAGTADAIVIAPATADLLAKLDPITGFVKYCSAGHPPALLLRANGELELLSEGGVLPGVVPAASFVEGSVHLSAGDVLLVCSDGILESLNDADQEFGYTRLEAQLRRAQVGAADAVLFSVLGAVQDFAAARPLVDDMSLVVVRRDSR